MRAIYVETVIDAPVDAVWRVTQDPAEHRRWDVRFGRIDPLPGGPPARFRYATTVLPGMTVAGWGVHAGERDRPDGSRTSALRFGSDDRRSLIATGSGYWRYLPGPAGVRFLTGYDYTPRWGTLGRAADRGFRPVFGWATAWSFDRLRIWLAHGVPPERSRRNATREAVARLLGPAATGALAGWLGATAATVALTVAVASALALALPPHPHTPAARRCRRRPPDRLATRPPELLEKL
ncbi:SRPBCC family protein [Micromonospora sp. NPDC126480]|uniref:SRPBCC family protein n=1 Tax=Micromonospora sp. NPDC126480 TaxID=3155312 RepID=UPI0033171546